MPPNELLANRVDYAIDVEPPFLIGERSLKDDLQQEVTELFAEHLWSAVIDRVDDFMGLFEHVLTKGFEGLFAIPRAAVGTEKCAHQLDEAR